MKLTQLVVLIKVLVNGINTGDSQTILMTITNTSLLMTNISNRTLERSRGSDICNSSTPSSPKNGIVGSSKNIGKSVGCDCGCGRIGGSVGINTGLPFYLKNFFLCLLL